ncbi:putative ribonuclease H-like domain-containing protein [Tanacetum coccineum]
MACLIAKATTDESNKWHRRLGHVNFKNLNKLVKGNLVRGLPSKIFQNVHTCVACQKGKQHKASCKAKTVSSISHSLQLLHMDLFGSTSVRSLNHKTYYLVITADFQNVHTCVACQKGKQHKPSCKAKTVSSISHSLQLLHMDLFGSTSMRSLNHKTYCLVITDDFSRFSWVFFLRTKDETSAILKGFIRQIENQLNQKVKTIRSDNGTEFKNKDVIEFCGLKGIKREYSNARTPQQNRVAERKNRTLIEAGIRKGPTWLFDLDYLTDSMNYHPVSSENQANLHAGQQEANQNAGTEEIIEAGDSDKEDESAQDCFILPIWPSYSSTITPALTTYDKREVIKEGAARTSSTNLVNTLSIPVSTASPHEGLSLFDPTNPEEDDSEIPPLEDIYQNSTDGIFTTSSYDDEGAVADFTNLETVVNVSPIPTLRIHSTHPKALILGDPNSAVQTRSKVNTSSGAHAFVSYKISEALEDESWVDAMQEELLQFEIHKVWVLVDSPYGKKAIGTKWVYRNKKDERGVVIRNKARLVAQGHRQEEGIDYDECRIPISLHFIQSITKSELEMRKKELF